METKNILIIVGIIVAVLLVMNQQGAGFFSVFNGAKYSERAGKITATGEKYTATLKQLSITNGYSCQDYANQNKGVQSGYLCFGDNTRSEAEYKIYTSRVSRNTMNYILCQLAITQGGYGKENVLVYDKVILDAVIDLSEDRYGSMFISSDKDCKDKITIMGI